MRGFVRGVAQLVASIAVFLLVRAFVVEMYKIPTPSMQRTLLVGDFLVVDKIGYGRSFPLTHFHLPAFRHPQRGEVIVFKWPADPSINFVKRVVGIPGDTLLMRSGSLYRNGRRVTEPYVTHTAPGDDASAADFRWQRGYLVPSLQASRSYFPSRNNWGPLVVPPSNYFVLGDNRDNSLDSRYWGFVPDSLVRGHPLFVYFSYHPAHDSRWGWLTEARWSRVGTVVR